MHKERFKSVIEVALFLVKDNKVLLMRRYNTGYEDGKYHVPAGHVDGGEEIRHAMQREAKEEVGIDIAIDDLRVVHVMHRNTSGGERIAFFLTTDRWSGEVVNAELHKCDEIRWCSLDELPENICPYVRQALHNFKVGVSYAGFGW